MIEVKELLVGLILGDGHVGRSGNESFITFEQTSKHAEYVSYLHHILTEAGILLYPIKNYTRSDKRYNSVTNSVYFKSHNLESLNYLADLFIIEERKVVSPDIGK